MPKGVTAGDDIERAGRVDDGPVGGSPDGVVGGTYAAHSCAHGEATEAGHCDDVGRVVTVTQELGWRGEPVEPTGAYDVDRRVVVNDDRGPQQRSGEGG